MLINDTNRRKLALYLKDYIADEMEGDDNFCQMEVIEHGLEAYESINQPKQYAISVSTRNFNGQMILLSDDKKVRLFDSITEANEYASSKGFPFVLCEYLPESGDYVVVS